MASGDTARRIVAAPEPSFAAGERRRPQGRIGGLVRFAPGEPAVDVAAADRDDRQRLLAALGPGATLLGDDDGALVADLDLLEDGDGRPVDAARLSHLLGVPRPADLALLASRLAPLDGAFVLAARLPGDALLLARDPLGERTLVYSRLADGRLLFASSLRALLATGQVARDIDPDALAAYLTYAYVPGRRTMIRGVFELLPGEMIVATATTLDRRFWWALPGDPAAGALRPPDELRDELRRRLERAVERRLPADAEPVGASLSGGIDSSLVVALAARRRPGALRTFSITFGAPYADELEWSSQVAAHCGTRHTIVELPAASIVARLDESMALLGDPIGDPLTVPNALLFREASREVGVLLNGEGGDPCFGGPKNIPMLLAELYGGSDDDHPRARHRSYLRAHGKCFDDLPDMLGAGLDARLAADGLEEELTPWFDDPRWGGLVNRLMAINVAFKGAHHILAKVDAESFPSGILPRAPLFDRRVVELAFETPPQAKLRGSTEKYLLKEAVRDLLPAAIVDRPKSGMLVPVEGWFQGPLRPIARERLLDGLAPWAIIDRAWIERLLGGRLPGHRPRRGAKIWLLVALESWLRGVVG